MDYYEKVARLSDQVALMGYDTMQPSEDMYSRVLAYEVGSLSPHIGCLFMVGLPSYDDNFPYHTKAETLPAGLRGAIAGGARHIAIYADWTTDEAEWGEVGRIWGNVNRKRGAAPARVAQSRGHSADVIDDVVP